jgi:hypothetical protein
LNSAVQHLNSGMAALRDPPIMAVDVRGSCQLDGSAAIGQLDRLTR